MDSEQTKLAASDHMNSIYRIAAGAVVGTFLVLVPYSFLAVKLDLLHIGLAILIVLSCGVLSGLWGGKFVESLTRLMNSSGLY